MRIAISYLLAETRRISIALSNAAGMSGYLIGHTIYENGYNITDLFDVNVLE